MADLLEDLLDGTEPSALATLVRFVWFSISQRTLQPDWCDALLLDEPGPSEEG